MAKIKNKNEDWQYNFEDLFEADFLKKITTFVGVVGNFKDIDEITSNIMNYTIKIDNKTRKAKSIVNMLKELAEDYPFLTIYDDSDVQKNILQELDARYEYMLEHPDDWKTWEEVKNNILNS